MSAISDAGQLRAAVLERYEELSPRLQQIAQFLLDDPHSMGVETLAVISDRVKVPASAIVRFAKTFGFEGAGPMQRVLKDSLLATKTTSAYHQRVRHFSSNAEGNPSPTPYQLLKEFSAASTMSLDHISEYVEKAKLAKAVRLIVGAETVYISGFRRSFPVAAYLSYLLQQAGKRAVFIDGVGGYHLQQGRQIRQDDLLLVSSFSPYAPEAIELVEIAKANGVKVLAITDSVVSAVAKNATCILQVRDSEVRGFRTLAASMCLAQSLAISFAFENDATR
ncbi:MAG: MurR/RpiR family transcriptional regulator [Sphingobium sp.]|nr:MurR/RpiR family transcriptional regulator [Sphingobium sp.]